MILEKGSVASQNDVPQSPPEVRRAVFLTRHKEAFAQADERGSGVAPGDITLPLLRTGKSALLPMVSAYAVSKPGTMSSPKPAGTGLAHLRIFSCPHLSVRQQALLCSDEAIGAGPSLERAE
ncbi:MAG: hypothetical protein L3K26_01275 [Candidatus Hydrogenedentes bacterium]|nr:hypothetical protein [Candidatus Hydrogenedentota bacterium]